MVIGTIMTAIVSTFKGYLLIDLFTSDAQVQEIGLSLIHFMVPTLITYITIEILSSTAWCGRCLDAIDHDWYRCMLPSCDLDYLFLPRYRSILAVAFAIRCHGRSPQWLLWSIISSLVVCAVLME